MSTLPQTIPDAWDYKGRPAERSKTGGWTAAAMILGVEACERLTVLGIAVNLVPYLTGTMHLGNASSANIVTNFMGTCFMLCLLGGFVADTFIGRYLTIAIFTTVEAIGVTILTISTIIPSLRPPKCTVSNSKTCEPATNMQLMVLYIALYTTALGIGGLKSSVSGFGSDQFDDSNEGEKKQMVKFFNWFFFFISLGSLTAVTVLVYIQDHVGRDWGYGLCVCAIVVALSVMLSGTRRYRFKKLAGSPLTQIAVVYVAAWRKRHMELPSDSSLLFNVDDESLGTKKKKKQMLPHSKQFRFIRKSMTDSIEKTKRPNNDEDCSITSPLRKRSKESCFVVNLSSDSHQDNEDKDTAVTERVSKLENGFKVMKESIDELKDIILKNVTQTPAEYVTSHNKKFPSTPTKLAKSGRVRKLFPSAHEKTGKPPFVLTPTHMGYRVTPDNNKATSPKLIGPSIPYWLSSMYKPKRIMNVNAEECAIATYIFGCPPNIEIDKNEVIVRTQNGYCDGTRRIFQCLKPRKLIYDDIIDLAVSMLTIRERNQGITPTIWFLPTLFAYRVLSWNAPIDLMINCHQKQFMGYADHISKIFLPIHDPEQQHWFLLVIDFKKKQLICLDSFPSVSANTRRFTSIKILALYMDAFLSQPAFYENEETHAWNIAEFKFVVPNGLGTQEIYSNDCAIWVINWMMQKGGAYYIN